MPYNEVFGGDTIFPSELSYLAISTGVDLTLQWAREQQIGGVNVVADFMDITTTAPSLNIDMPSATAVSTGNRATFNNVGANSYTVRDNTGGTIQAVAPGEQWILVLTDNTTTAGTWTTFQLGASVSVASAGALAGAGIKAISTTLNQKIDSDVEAATPFTVVDGDRAKCLIYTAGAGTANLPSSPAVGNDWFFMLRNSGSGTLNVLPAAGLVDGVASINLEPGDSAFFFTDGTNFFSVGLSSGSTVAFDFVSIAIPGSGDFVLSGANLNRISYRFTGVITGNRKIVVPGTTQQYWVDNQTTGAFTLTVGTAAGAAPAVPQGLSTILYSDSVDVVGAVTATSVAFPITVAQGGTGAITAPAALANLGAAPAIRLINTTAPLAGGGDLTGDRTFTIPAPTETTRGAPEIATQAEVDAFTDDVRYITPLKLHTKPGNTQTAVKEAGEFKSADASIAADADLVIPVVINTRYAFELFIRVSIASGGTGIQWAMLGPAGSVRASFDVVFEDDDFTLDKVANDGSNYAFLSFANLVTIRISGTIEVGGTAGNCSFGWAQSISDASATQVRENSQMTLTKLN